MNAFHLELSWLVYIATRDTWMSDAEHLESKRTAWRQAKALAREDPQRFAAMPDALAAAMKSKTTDQLPSPNRKELAHA